MMSLLFTGYFIAMLLAMFEKKQPAIGCFLISFTVKSFLV